MATIKRTRKSKSATSSSGAALPTRHQPAFSADIQDAIRLRAYSIYEQRGREHGHDIDDWLIAEAEVIGNASSHSG